MEWNWNEMPWNEKYILSSGTGAADAAGAARTGATFKITDAKFYVSVVTLLTKDNVKLTNQLNHVWKGSVYWKKVQDNC